MKQTADGRRLARSAMAALACPAVNLFYCGVLLAAGLCGTASAAPRQMQIAFGGYTNRSEALSNFPVLVVLSNNVSSGFTFADFVTTSGYDLRFVADPEDEGSLNYEIESWNTDAGQASYVWVQVPTLPPDGSGAIWAKWGDAGNSSQLPCTTNGAVWTNGYRGVWHFNESSGTKVYDATSNKTSGTLSGGVTVHAPGVVAGGDQYDGVNGLTTMDNEDLFDFGVNPFCVLFWVKNDKTGASKEWTVVSKYGNPGWEMEIHTYSPALAMGTYVNPGAKSFSVDSLAPAGDWHHIALVRNGDTMRIYADGIEKSKSTQAAFFSDFQNALSLQIAKPIYAGTGFGGSIDELRLAAAERSSNYVWACWFNQASNTLFNTYGAMQAQSGGSGGPDIRNQPVSSVTTNGATFNGWLASTGTSATAVCVFWGEQNGAVSGAWAYTNWFDGTAWTNNSYPSTNMTLSPDKTYYYTFGASNATTNAVASPIKFLITGGVTVQATDNQAQYPGNTAVFTITRPSTATNEELTVNYTMSGSAGNGTDYVSLPGSVSISAGQSSATVTLTARADLDTTNEQAVLTLTGGGNYNYPVGAPGSASITILPMKPTGYTYWDGANASWTTAANWSIDPDATTPDPVSPPGASDNAFFSISRDTDGATVSLNGDQSVLGLVYGTTSGNIYLQGGGTDRTLTIGTGGITDIAPTSGTGIGDTTAGQKVNVLLNGSQLWKAGNSGGFVMYVHNAVSRLSSDTINRTLLLDIGTTYQGQIVMKGAISDGGASGTLGLWKIGPATLTLSGTNTFSGGLAISQGGLNVTPAALSSAGPLVLRGASSHDGVTLYGASSTFTNTDVRVVSGVNTLVLDATSTFTMGTIARSGGVLKIDALAGQTYKVGNANVNGILGPWAVATSVLYLRNNGSGVIEALPAPAATTQASWMDPTANYAIDNTANLTADRFANTIQGSLGSAINLGSSGDNDLTVNGLLAISSSWTIDRTSTSTGRLIIGDTKELVLSGTAAFNISAPIVDNTAGASTLTLALWQPSSTALVTLSGTNTYSGGTIYGMAANTATLNINSAYALGTGPFYMNGVSSAGNVPVANIDNSSAADITLSNNNAQYWNSDFTYVGTRNLNMGTGNVSLGSYPGATRTVTVTTNTFTIGGVISDGTHAHLPTKALTKAGAGTLELTGASTYSGATTVSAGTVKLGASGSLASTNITVAAGATMQLAGSASLADTAAIDASGVIQLATGVKEQVGSLSLGGVAQAVNKSYGSTASAADIRNDTYFSGSGILLVGTMRPIGTMIFIR